MPSQPAWFHRLDEILDTPRTMGEILILSGWRVWFESRSRTIALLEVLPG